MKTISPTIIKFLEKQFIWWWWQFFDIQKRKL